MPADRADLSQRGTPRKTYWSRASYRTLKLAVKYLFFRSTYETLCTAETASPETEGPHGLSGANFFEKENPVKRSLAVMLLAAVAALLAGGQTGNGQEKSKADSKATIEQEFRKIENIWADADKNKDPVALGPLLGDDWLYLGPLGTETKAQHLAGLKTGDRSEER